MSFLKKQRLRYRALLGICFMSILTLSSCTRIEWAVRFADTYLYWKISEQFDFSGEAKKVTKKETSNFVRKVRDTHLPLLSQAFSQSAEELETLPAESPSSLQKWVRQKLEETEKLSNSLLAAGEPHLLKILEHVEKENWESFLSAFEKTNSKILKKPARCEDKFEDHLDDWIGRLNSDQKIAIKTYCQTRGDTREKRVENRNRLLQDFLNSLEFENSDFQKEAFLGAARQWIQKHNTLKSLNQPKEYQKNRELLTETLSRILSLSSKQQKDKLILNLREKSKNLEKLTL